MDNTAGLDVVDSDLERLVDALKFSQTGTRPKPDHLRLLGIQLKSARRIPLGDFRDTAGQIQQKCSVHISPQKEE